MCHRWGYLRFSYSQLYYCLCCTDGDDRSSVGVAQVAYSEEASSHLKSGKNERNMTTGRLPKHCLAHFFAALEVGCRINILVLGRVHFSAPASTRNLFRYTTAANVII